MTEAKSQVAERLRPFGTTIFSEMTRLAGLHGAINLAQGFPDFQGPPAFVAAAKEAMDEGQSQYARSRGHLELTRAVAAHQRQFYGLEYDPESEIVVTSGATEAVTAALLGLLNPGDELVVFEPYYDSYPAAAAMAQAVVRHVTLYFPGFALDESALERAITPKTRAILLNTPHNPTGKVFSASELAIIARIAVARDLWVITDEVYEHLCYGGAKHVPIASLPGMRERTLTISSAGKSYSYTGWKVGWAIGPAPLVDAVQAAHQFITFATATPLQVGVARGLYRLAPDFYDSLRREFTERRDLLASALEAAGLVVSVPEGTYFLMADFTPVWFGDDRSFVEHLVEKVKVAAIPPRVFYGAAPDEGSHLVRFAFCKKRATLEVAASRIRSRWP